MLRKAFCNVYQTSMLGGRGQPVRPNMPVQPMELKIFRFPHFSCCAKIHVQSRLDHTREFFPFWNSGKLLFHRAVKFCSRCGKTDQHSCSSFLSARESACSPITSFFRSIDGCLWQKSRDRKVVVYKPDDLLDSNIFR